MRDAAVITGAAGALGRAIAEQLSQDVEALLLVDLPSDGLTAAKLELERRSGISIAELACDITNADAPAHVAAALRALDWSPRVLVNNAGINRDALAVKMTAEQFSAVIDVDLVAPARLAMGLRDQLGTGASVINIASRAALGNFGQANYVAAKSGLIALTRALALRWAPDVRVNAIAPGLVETPMTAGMPEKVLSSMIARIPAGRMAQPTEIANTVRFCASPAASYLTGQLIVACGGRSIAP